MQAIERAITQIRQQLGRLSVNARLLIGSMMVILVMALLLVSQYAGRPDMMPLGLPNTPDVRASAIRYLESSGIAHEDRGSDIYVQAGRQYEVVGQLNERGIVGAGEIDFNALIDKQSNPFLSRDQSRQMWLTAKQNVLSAMIAARQDVAGATVVIGEPTGAPGIGRASILPTASVSVRMKSGALTQESADAIGRMVAASHAGLKPENVTVVDTLASRAFKPRSDDVVAGGQYLEQKNRIEQHFQRTIESALSRVPGAVVTVNAVVKNTRETRNVRTVDEPRIGVVSSETRDFTSVGSLPSGEAGMAPNTGASIRGMGRGSQTTESVSKERTDPQFGGAHEVIQDATGYPILVNALVGMPKSYFVKIWQDGQATPDAVPDAAALAQVVEAQTAQWQEDLALLIRTDGLADTMPGTVRVSMIHDFEATLTSGMPAPLGVATVSNLLEGGGLVKNLVLAGLALLSVVMMFLMVRRANVREPLPSPAETAGILPSLGGDGVDVVGEAEEGEAILEGLELDDATLRMQELLKQINETVKARPEEAAAMFQRWATSEVG